MGKVCVNLSQLFFYLCRYLKTQLRDQRPPGSFLQVGFVPAFVSSVKESPTNLSAINSVELLKMNKNLPATCVSTMVS